MAEDSTGLTRDEIRWIRNLKRGSKRRVEGDDDDRDDVGASKKGKNEDRAKIDAGFDPKTPLRTTETMTAATASTSKGNE